MKPLCHRSPCVDPECRRDHDDDVALFWAKKSELFAPARSDYEGPSPEDLDGLREDARNGRFR